MTAGAREATQMSYTRGVAQLGVKVLCWVDPYDTGGRIML